MIKEKYFSDDDLEEKSQNMRYELFEYRQRHRNQVIVPSALALLVLDMQKHFLNQDSHAFVPSAPAILSGIQALINKFDRWSLPVIFTKHIDDADYPGIMGKWWNDTILPGSDQSAFVDAFDIRNHTLIQKATYDAFHLTPLDDILKAKGIKQLVITGLLTHLCCESTARSAFHHNYEVFFTIDGTATYNERHHMSTLFNLSHGFAVPVLVDEVLHAFER